MKQYSHMAYVRSMMYVLIKGARSFDNFWYRGHIVEIRMVGTRLALLAAFNSY